MTLQGVPAVAFRKPGAGSPHYISLTGACMGSVLSHAHSRLRKFVCRVCIQILRFVVPLLDRLLRRISKSPGLPVLNPTVPYWMIPPSPISRYNAEETSVPDFADVVIIGSGITGTSFARAFLDHFGNEENVPRVIMLEARETCSGATGRNGGHITPVLYSQYSELKQDWGVEMAKKIIRFRLSHLPELLAVAEAEGLIEDSQCREVEGFDVFYDPSAFQTAKEELASYRKDLPAESVHYKLYEGEACIKSLHLSTTAVGCLSTRGGAVHPYRLVTGILSRLLKSYPSSFHLYTQTPCTAISSPNPGESKSLYHVTTPKGTIRASHIIHATNGWISHLLPVMRGKIIPARGTVIALRTWKTTEKSDLVQVHEKPPPQDWTGTRSFVFYPVGTISTYDYLTQQPAGPLTVSRGDAAGSYPPPEGELMFGGGFKADLESIGSGDDSSWNVEIQEHLVKAIGAYFTCGEEVGSSQTDRLKSVWSGVLGFSVDEKPWVGRVPERISGRRVPVANGASALCGSGSRLAAPGEWMAAGYTGEGMVHAWMSGKALACMVLGLDTGGNREFGQCQFPSVFGVTEERWRDATVEEKLFEVIPEMVY